MNWNSLKEYLKIRNRIEHVSNPRTNNETIILWNGSSIVKYDSKKRINDVLIMSFKPINIFEKVFVSNSKTIYEYNKYENKQWGFELPPIKGEKKPIRINKSNFRANENNRQF